jgi:hypothetical protein
MEVRPAAIPKNIIVDGNTVVQYNVVSEQVPVAAPPLNSVTSTSGVAHAGGVNTVYIFGFAGAGPLPDQLHGYLVIDAPSTSAPASQQLKIVWFDQDSATATDCNA